MNKKTAIVTGAAKGIGLAIARELQICGYTVYGTYVSDYNPEEITALERDSFRLLRFDSSVQEDCRAVADRAVEDTGRIDVLVNNAGITRDDLLLRMSGADFEKVLDTNLTGAFYMMSAVTKTMIRQRYGRVVNISSVVGITGNAGQTNYAASKAGLIGLSKSAAKELASRNITVNCVAPGFIATDMTDVLKDDCKEAILNQIPMKRFGEPSDVAKAVAFLVSENAGYITGEVLSVCGGMVM